MLSQSVPVLLILAALGVVIYFVWRIRRNADVYDGAPMPGGARRILTGYLLAFGTALVYILVSLNSIDFPQTAVMPEMPTPTPSPSPAAANAPKPTPTPAASPTPAIPVLIRVFPQHTVGSAPSVAVTVYGRNFTKESKVRFNMRREATDYISDNLITAPLQPADLVGVGSITIDVVTGDLQSNAINLPVHKPIVPLNVFGWHPWITREVQLLLLVIFAGALGSYLHAIMSLADFIGNRTLTASWFWWYVTRPFLGMAMALVFYSVLRGGFVAGSPADANVVNPFGVLAIGALVGMFADKAAQKLGEVFDVVFKSSDPRTGKLNVPVIDKLVPDTVFAGGTKPVLVKLIGDRLGKVSIVRLNSEDRTPATVTEKEISFNLTVEDMKAPRQIKVTAVNPDGGVSTSATLYVSDLSITDAVLPDAKAGTDYAGPIMSASGGAQPYKWSLVNQPNWLSIDEKTGQLKGKPGTADVKDIKVTVKVVDKEGASASNELNLKVTA